MGKQREKGETIGKEKTKLEINRKGKKVPSNRVISSLEGNVVRGVLKF